METAGKSACPPNPANPSNADSLSRSAGTPACVRRRFFGRQECLPSHPANLSNAHSFPGRRHSCLRPFPFHTAGKSACPPSRVAIRYLVRAFGSGSSVAANRPPTKPAPSAAVIVTNGRKPAAR